MLRTLVAVSIALCCLVAVGCRSEQAGPSAEGERSAAAIERRAQRDLAGAPAPLAALHRQGGELLDGGVDGFRKRLGELRGYPVVVNKWGSWCGPCRAEFPYFQDQAIEHGKQVAFLGVDGQDPAESAERFLAEYPVPYPSYKDFELEISSKELKAVAAFPSTVFYDRRGEITHVKQGTYENARELGADIRRYAR